MNGRGLPLRNGRDGRELREGQASAGVTISQVWEHLRATVAAVCFQSPSNLYSDSKLDMTLAGNRSPGFSRGHSH
jgi:hypothetical protein